MFDIILELDSNDRNAWTIIDDVAQAVDDVLAGKEYKVSVFVRGETCSALMRGFAQLDFVYVKRLFSCCTALLEL